jgi:hypothetical protein
MAGDPSGGCGPQVTDDNGRKCRDRIWQKRRSMDSLTIASTPQGINCALGWTSPAKEALLSTTW